MSEPRDEFRRVAIPPDIEREALTLLGEGKLLLAMKCLHETTKLPFFECKCWVTERIPSPPLPPCPYRGKPLRTDRARQCFECGADWHDPPTVRASSG